MAERMALGALVVAAGVGLFGCTKSTDVGDGCTYGGKHYAAGDSFASSDGCNQCSCGEDGQVACTLKACVDASVPSELSWFATCGAAVCGPGTDGPTGQPLCTTQQAGERCEQAEKDDLCDPSIGCGVNLVCASSDPTMGPGGCPISRARYKQDIHYLNAEERHAVAADLLATPLARFRYKHDQSGGEQLGFVIDDVEPSPSVQGDHVSLYGYTSMAVAALQEQAERTQALERELSQLKLHLGELEQRCVPTARGVDRPKARAPR